MSYNVSGLNAVGTKSMTLVVNLSPELEEQLREKAVRQGQDINTVASELLASILKEEAEAVKGIQQGLDDFSTGKFRSFDEYAHQQRQKYNLPA
jgi:predicted transcriptional regulator